MCGAWHVRGAKRNRLDRHSCVTGRVPVRYKSIESFVNAAIALNNGETTLEALDLQLPTLATTAITTASPLAGASSRGVPQCAHCFDFPSLMSTFCLLFYHWHSLFASRSLSLSLSLLLPTHMVHLSLRPTPHTSQTTAVY